MPTDILANEMKTSEIKGEEDKLPNIDDSIIKKEGDESVDEDEEEENEAIGKIFDLPPEDIHEAQKVVL